MSWVGRFGKRPHGIVTQDELFAILELMVPGANLCSLCNEPAVGLIHCNDCGWTRRLCNNHRPKTPEVEHVKKLHAAICEPVAGSN
jgi:hypothetical protein